MSQVNVYTEHFWTCVSFCIFGTQAGGVICCWAVEKAVRVHIILFVEYDWKHSGTADKSSVIELRRESRKDENKCAIGQEDGGSKLKERM